LAFIQNNSYYKNKNVTKRFSSKTSWGKEGVSGELEEYFRRKIKRKIKSCAIVGKIKDLEAVYDKRNKKTSKEKSLR